MQVRSTCVKKAVSLERTRIWRSRTNVLAVIIDNTNIRMDECKIYFQKASNYGYVVIIVEPRTSWKRDADILNGEFHRTCVHLATFYGCRTQYTSSSQRRDRNSSSSIQSIDSILFWLVSQRRTNEFRVGSSEGFLSTSSDNFSSTEERSRANQSREK